MSIHAGASIILFKAIQKRELKSVYTTSFFFEAVAYLGGGQMGNGSTLAKKIKFDHRKKIVPPFV